MDGEGRRGKASRQKREYDKRVSGYFNEITRDLHALPSEALKRGDGEHRLSEMHNALPPDKKLRKAFAEALGAIVNGVTPFDDPRETTLSGKTVYPHMLVRKAALDFASAHKIRVSTLEAIINTDPRSKDYSRYERALGYYDNILPDDRERSRQEREGDFRAFRSALIAYGIPSYRPSSFRQSPARPSAAPSPPPPPP